MLIRIGKATEEAMEILGIKEYPFTETTLRTIKKALVLQYHPDKNKDPEATEKMKEINCAFDILESIALPEITDEKSRVAKELYDIEKEDIFVIWEPCGRCNQTGKVVTNISVNKKPKYIASICHSCSGIGKRKLNLFNPLIPKGAILKR